MFLKTTTKKRQTGEARDMTLIGSARPPPEATAATVDYASCVTVYLHGRKYNTVLVSVYSFIQETC